MTKHRKRQQVYEIKPMQDNQEASREESKRHKEHCNASVYMKTGVEVDLVEGVKKQLERHHEDNSASGKKQLFWTKVGAVLIFAYATITLWQACLTREMAQTSLKTYEATNRPYIGATIRAWHVWTDKDGRQQADASPSPQTRILSVDLEFKNYGAVAATNVRDGWKVFVAGEIIPGQSKAQVTTLAPGAPPKHLLGEIGTHDYPDVRDGKKSLTIEFTCEYDGPSHSYSYCEKYEYRAPTGQFVNLGADCSK